MNGLELVGTWCRMLGGGRTGPVVGWRGGGTSSLEDGFAFEFEGGLLVARLDPPAMVPELEILVGFVGLESVRVRGCTSLTGAGNGCA